MRILLNVMLHPLEKLVRWQHPLIFILPIEMSLALFLLGPLNVAGCRWITRTLLLI